MRRHTSVAGNGRPLKSSGELHGGNVYHTARRMGWDWREILDFSANINPLGFPDSVRRAIESSIERIAHYPEIGSPDLRRAAARHWAIPEEQVLVGNGATDLIYFLIRTLQPSKTLLVVPTFSEYRPALAECTVAAVPLERELDYQPDFSKISSRIGDLKPDLLVLTQPNNPTGAGAHPEQLHSWLCEGVPKQVAVLLDESFIDFAGQPSSVGLTALRPRLFVLRSLTKFYALPGLRVGCMAADGDSIAALEGVREPWQTNVLAECAAVCALADDSFRQRSIQVIGEERMWLWNQLRKIPGIDLVPTSANFIFAHSERPVSDVQTFLLKHKILIRNCTGMEGVDGEAFRLAVRTRPENTRLVGCLEEFFC